MRRDLPLWPVRRPAVVSPGPRLALVKMCLKGIAFMQGETVGDSVEEKQPGQKRSLLGGAFEFGVILYLLYVCFVINVGGQMWIQPSDSRNPEQRGVRTDISLLMFFFVVNINKNKFVFESHLNGL